MDGMLYVRVSGCESDKDQDFSLSGSLSFLRKSCVTFLRLYFFYFNKVKDRKKMYREETREKEREEEGSESQS